LISFSLGLSYLFLLRHRLWLDDLVISVKDQDPYAFVKMGKQDQDQANMQYLTLQDLLQPLLYQCLTIRLQTLNC